MAFEPGKTFKISGGLIPLIFLLIVLLAACGSESANPAPTATLAPTTVASTAVAITTAAATTGASGTANEITNGTADGTANATVGPVVTVTPTSSPTPAPTNTPAPTPTPPPTSTPVPSPTATPLGGATNPQTGGFTGSNATAQGDFKGADGKALGHVVLTQGTDGVKVALTYNGIPVGDHGIHFHAIGQCDAPDFTSAGAHFNPENKKHGLLSPDGPHAGDLPDLVVPASGAGLYNVTTNLLTLKDGPDALFGPYGASLVLTANPDDQKTDPNGNSGQRIACAVLTPGNFTVTAQGAYTPVPTIPPTATPVRSNGTATTGPTPPK